MAITVTAHESGSTFGGGLLRVKVLTGVATSQAGAATATFGGTGAQQASITTTATGSIVYGALKTSSTTTLTANGSTTLFDNLVDNQNGEILGSCRSTAVTGTPGAVTIGASAPSVGGQTALLEALPSGTIAEDASSPAVVSSVTASWVDLVTASFTPPAGSLLVAMVAADANGSTVVTVSGGGLTWTERVHSLAAGGATGYSGVWTAQIPAAVTPTGGPAQYAPGWYPGAPGLPGGAPFAWAQTVAPGLPPPPAVIVHGAAGTYDGIPGKAIPGLFIPGSPGPVIPGLQETAAAAYAPGWYPGAPGMPGGIPFLAIPQGTAPAPPAAAVVSGPPVYPLGHPVQARQQPLRGGTVTCRTGVFGQLGPAVKALTEPVRARVPQPSRGGQAQHRTGAYGGIGPAVKALASAVVSRLRGFPPRGRTAARTGTYGQLGPPVKPASAPVQARQLPRRGGTAQGRAGTFTSTAVVTGPPVYPLGHPVQAKRLPQRGGSTSARRGTYGQLGPPVKPASGPVQARQPLPPHGRAQSRAGTFTVVVTGSGPPVYPLGHPVQARRQPQRGGRVVKAAGTYAGTGPVVQPQQGPVSAARRPLPARGRTQSQRGPYGQTGPPVIPLRRPVTIRRTLPPRGSAAWRSGTYVPPPPFTIGTLTASDKATGVLTGATVPGGSGGVLTASDTRTGGPGG